MQHSFWQSRWDENRIGFHLDHANPNLVRHWDELVTWRAQSERQLSSEQSSENTVLLPLCGKSRDLTWLAERGHSVIGVEFVEQAARQYFDECGVSPEASKRGAFLELGHQSTRLLVGDFFRLTSAELGKVDFVYDRAALVAIAPERRSAYVARLRKVLRPGGRLLLVTFEHDMPSGPPFSVPEVAELFSSWTHLEQRRQSDILEHEPHFQARGATRLLETTWFIQL